MLRYEFIGIQIESHRQPVLDNLQLISVIEAINFVLLWKGNRLDTHACKNAQTYSLTSQSLTQNTHAISQRAFIKVFDDGAATAPVGPLFILLRLF